MIWFMIMVLAGLAPGAAAAPNLLKNPSFEKEGAAPDLAADWSRWGQWMNLEQGWTPTHSGKGLIGYHHWQIEKAEDSGIYQDVNVVQGERYVFSVFVSRDDPGNKTQAQEVELRLESTVDGHQVTIASMTAQVKDLALSPAWSRLSVKGTAANGALRVLVRVVPAKDGPRGGALKIDDAALLRENVR